MENPATWGKAEQVVHDVRLKWEEDRENVVLGLSLERRITNALRQEGLLLNEDDCPNCKGMGSDPTFGNDVPCYTCGGSGRVS